MSQASDNTAEKSAAVTSNVTPVQQFTELLGYPPPAEYGLPDVCPECERPNGHSGPHGMAQDDDYPPRRIAREAHLDAMAAAHAVSREAAGRALHTAWQESFTPKERAWGIPWDNLADHDKMPWLLAAEYAHHHTATLRQLLRLAVLRMREASDLWNKPASGAQENALNALPEAFHHAMWALVRAVDFQLPRAADLVQPVKRGGAAAVDIGNAIADVATMAQLAGGEISKAVATRVCALLRELGELRARSARGEPQGRCGKGLAAPGRRFQHLATCAAPSRPVPCERSPAKVYLIEKFPYEQRDEDVEQTMAVGTSYASAAGLVLRLIDICGGDWRYDSLRQLWQETRPDGWALRISTMQADRCPWHNAAGEYLFREA